MERFLQLVTWPTKTQRRRDAETQEAERQRGREAERQRGKDAKTQRPRCDDAKTRSSKAAKQQSSNAANAATQQRRAMGDLSILTFLLQRRNTPKSQRRQDFRLSTPSPVLARWTSDVGTPHGRPSERAGRHQQESSPQVDWIGPATRRNSQIRTISIIGNSHHDGNVNPLHPRELIVIT